MVSKIGKISNLIRRLYAPIFLSGTLLLNCARPFYYSNNESRLTQQVIHVVKKHSTRDLLGLCYTEAYIDGTPIEIYIYGPRSSKKGIEIIGNYILLPIFHIYDENANGKIDKNEKARYKAKSLRELLTKPLKELKWKRMKTSEYRRILRSILRYFKKKEMQKEKDPVPKPAPPEEDYIYDC